MAGEKVRKIFFRYLGQNMRDGNKKRFKDEVFQKKKK